MILVLRAPDEEPDAEQNGSREDVVSRPMAELDQVLDWVEDSDVDRVIVPWPCPGFNPFALARRLRQSRGPAVVLAGALRPATRFWAERNGCQVAASTTDALQLEGERP